MSKKSAAHDEAVHNDKMGAGSETKAGGETTCSVCGEKLTEGDTVCTMLGHTFCSSAPLAVSPDPPPKVRNVLCADCGQSLFALIRWMSLSDHRIQVGFQGGLAFYLDAMKPITRNLLHELLTKHAGSESLMVEVAPSGNREELQVTILDCAENASRTFLLKGEKYAPLSRR